MWRTERLETGDWRRLETGDWRRLETGDWRLETDLGILKPAVDGRVAHDVGAVRQLQFPHGVGLVYFDRLDADVQFGGDVFIAVADSHEPQHVRLTRGNRSAVAFERVPVHVSRAQCGVHV